MQEYLAATTIYPSRFISVSKGTLDTDQGAVTQSIAYSIPVGVSLPNTANAFCPQIALAGQYFLAYIMGECALLELGGTVAYGQYVAPDSLGRGVTAPGNSWAGGYAEQAGVSGELIRFRVMPVYQKTAGGFYSPGFSSGFN